MKKLLIMLFICILTISLSACGKELKDKKEFTIKDVVNDKNLHAFWAIHNDGTDVVLDQVMFTKNGQVKSVPADEVMFTPKFFDTATPSEIENKVKKELPKAYKQAKWHKPNYIVMTNDEGSPLLTFVVPEDKNLKANNPKRIAEHLQNAAFGDTDMVYTNLMLSQSQDPTSEIKYYAEYTYDPVVINPHISNDKDNIHFNTIIKKGQKPIQLTKNEIKNDDDVIAVKRSTLENYLK